MTRFLTHLVLLCVALAGTTGAQDTSHIERRRLDAEQTIGGVRCASTGRAYAEVYPNGSLRECPLARDTTVAGNAFAAGSWILLDETGRLRSAWLMRDAPLGGQTCRGTGYKGFHVTFHDDGSLRSCYLAQDTVIRGIPCIRGSFWNELRGGSKSVAVFAPDGSLAGCQLSTDAMVDGRRYRKWDRWMAGNR